MRFPASVIPSEGLLKMASNEAATSENPRRTLLVG